ncbi:Fucose 4-O-acetylase [Selenomonas ruminantium]|uniref:Fucose 4-O-acetylase n=1 Tax=Selenomonas ruminantium TaxID=971 RepID=A0A1I3FNS1_SELRU|nr:acyltransferase family protein [Selenomonas ruminantium]SFI12806.1 Fucose 4-O-acetylase [Selenomonas ruminantium]
MRSVELQPKRNKYLDIVKFFAIFCVLWGHVVQQTCLLVNPNDDYIFRFIYTFHMPLFMGICGYFFAKSLRKYGRKYYIDNKLKTRLLGLIIPMLSFGILKICISGKFDLLHYLEAAHGVWFLGDLAINTVMILVISKWCSGSFSHDAKCFLLGIPFVSIPKIGYGAQGLFMYLFFVGGYWLAVYYKKSFSTSIRYWKLVLMIFILSFVVFGIIPYEPSAFTFDINKYDFVGIVLIDVLKIIMGISGCFLILMIIYKIMPCLKGTSLECYAIEQGQYTLDIYLLNIIILEKICGPLYRNIVKYYQFNILHSYGILFEFISTLIVTCLIMIIITTVGKIMNKNHYIAKIFFYR